MTDAERKFQEIIAEHGWHVMQVRNREDETGPTFSYSTGLWKNFKHPELIIFGLSEELEHVMINNAGYDIKTGVRRFSAENYYDDFLEGFDVLMIEVDDIQRKEYATWTDWYYDRQPFPLLQCVYPNTKGVWPWEEAANAEFPEIQPLLSSKFSF